MKEMLVRWVWKFLGYGCCRPLHSHNITALFDEHHARVRAGIQQQLDDLRGQVFEYLRQSAEAEKDKVVNVRLIK